MGLYGAAVRGKDLSCGVERKMLPSVRGENGKLRHDEIRLAPDVRIGVEHRKTDQYFIMKEEEGFPFGVGKVSVKIPVMVFALCIHRIGIIERHFVQVFLVDVPKKLPLLFSNRSESNHHSIPHVPDMPRFQRQGITRILAAKIVFGYVPAQSFLHNRVYHGFVNLSTNRNEGIGRI